MKTFKAKQNLVNYIIGTSFIFMLTLFSNNVIAQETVNVSGIVKGESEPLADVSIYVKGSKTGTVSKSNGRFTYPSPIKIGDKLVFSFLGYTTKTITITSSSTNLEVLLEEAPIDVLSAPNTNAPYKSKRTRN